MNGRVNGFPCACKRTAADSFLAFESERNKRKRRKTKPYFVIRPGVVPAVACVIAAVCFLFSSSPEKQPDLNGSVNDNTVKTLPVYSVTEAVYSASDFETVTAKITVEPVKAANCSLSNAVAVGKITASDSETSGSEKAIKGATFASYTVSAPATVPVNGRLTSPFGYRTNPVSGNYGFHTGIDLAAPEGTPVAAAYGGSVTDSGENDVWGKYVLIKHSDGFETYYCHLNEIYADEGTVLKKGETLGLVGSTGWSTGPHLHFEVRIDGVRVDPEPLVFGNEN